MSAEKRDLEVKIFKSVFSCILIGNSMLNAMKSLLFILKIAGVLNIVIKSWYCEKVSFEKNYLKVHERNCDDT